MKIQKSGIGLILLGIWFMCSSTLSAGNEKIPLNMDNQPYVLFITADGFRSDYIEWYHPAHIKQLMQDGVRVIHAKNVFPTVTTPNMTSLVTGAYPRTTGIAFNQQYVKELDKIVSGPRDNQAETISETFQKAGWKTAAVNHFMLKDRGVDYYLSPGYDEAEKTTNTIIDLIKNKQVHFIAAIYGKTDSIGHRYGPESEEMRKTVLEIDTQIGRLVATLKQMGIYDKTMITFNADHGMSSFEKKQSSVEPAVLLAKAGYKVAQKASEINSNTQLVVLSGGVRLVYFRTQFSKKEQDKIAGILSEIKGAEILDRNRLDELHCHNNRSGDIIVSPLPGYAMSDAGHSGGLHGRFTEQNPVLLFWGYGVNQGITVDNAETVDIVPTLLQLAGISPANTVEGKSISNVIKTELK